MPDRSPDSLSPAEELFADWLARREGGAGAEDLEAFCHDHPKEAAELRRLWVTWQGLRGVLEKAGFSSGPRSLTRRIQEEFGSGVDPNISLDAGEGNVPPSDALLKRLAEHTLKTSRYQLRGEIARGGMGAILKVWDEDLRRALAMKVILGKAEEVGTGGTPPVNRRLLARFVEEAQVTGQLDHPGIVPVHELGLDSDGHVFFTMKLVKGRDLKAIFEQVFAGNTDWTEARAIGVILKVCEAMAYAHAKGVVHRDLKPDNVMVGSFGEVYVMDWGLARVLGRKDTHDIRLQSASAPHSSIQTERREEREGTPDSPLVTMDGDVVGTPAYMPPEQARGEIERLGPQSDVYSIGAMLYHLLTRHMPYVPAGARASNRAVLGMVLHGPPPEVRRNRVDVPGELAAICEKAMAREPALRYRDTLELASDLRAYLEGRVVRAYEAGAWAEARKWVARNKGLAASVAAAGIALVYGAVAHEQAQGKRAAEEQRVIAEEQRMRAQENEALARTEKARADANALKAEGLAKTARYQSYVANIRSADAALELNEGRNARRFLDEAPEEHRNWEWRYLDAQTDGSLLVLRHGGSVRTAEFSPDGKNVLTASDDGSNRLWGADDGRELLVMSGHTGRFARYSPDGKRIVTSSGDELAAVWDVARREEMAVLRGHSDDITLARFSPDGSRIATGSNDGTVRVWDAAKGSELVVLRGHESWIWDIDFGPDGRRLATGSHDATVRVWDLETGKQRVLLRGGESPNSLSTCASFSTNDRWVVAAFDDYTVRVWDVGSVGSLYTKVEVAVLEGHKGWIRSVSFPRFGNMVATASDDGTARLWDPGRTEVTVLRGHTGDVFLARFNRDGSGLLTVSSDETARVWDVAGGTQASVLRGHEGPVLDGAFSPDDLRVVTASDDGTARVWDASGNAEARTLRGHEGSVNAAAFSPDATRVITSSEDGTARLWDTGTGTELFVLRGHHGIVTSAAFSPDGGRVLTCGDEFARVWDADSGAALLVLRGHARAVGSAVFSPDGSRIVTTSFDSTVRCWDAEKGGCLRTLSIPRADSGGGRRSPEVVFDPRGSRVAAWEPYGNSLLLTHAATGEELFVLTSERPIETVSFSQDGSRVLAGVPTGCMMWDAGTGLLLLSSKGHRSNVWSVAFSPDGRRIATASGDRTARLWDASSGEELAVLRDHTQSVWSVVFDHDGSRLLTASGDGTARIWDAENGTALVVLRGHTDQVTAASFSSDGERVLTKSSDGTARIWDTRRRPLRYQEQLELSRAEPRARQTCEESLAAFQDCTAAANRIRENAGLDPVLRQATLRLLSLESRPIQEEATAWVESLYAEDPFREGVIRRLSEDTRRKESVRRAAMRLAPLAEDASRLNSLAWGSVARSEEGDPAALDRALRMSQRAVELSPSGSHLNTLGVALYRAERIDEALEALTRSNVENGGYEPADLAFLAMTHHRLGHAQEARVALADLRELLSDHDDPEGRAFLLEAEGLMQE